MKIAETSKLRDVIEDSIESTNEEISKMNVRTHRHPIRTLPTQCPPHLIGYPVVRKLGVGYASTLHRPLE
eukprot:4362180-Pyramimonas_sp.AAC.1